MILDTTTLSLEILLGGAVVANQLPVNVEFSEIVSGVPSAKHQDAQTNGATAVTILTAPDAGTKQRVARNINIFNADTAVATVTVRVNNNSTMRQLVKTTLQVDQTLEWSAEKGWRILTLNPASDTAAGIIEIAVQAEMEAGTDVLRAVTPGRQHYHPSAAKCWGKAVGAGTSLTVNYNITSVSDTGTGRLGVTIATDFSSANYVIQAELERGVTTLAVADVEQVAIRNASPAAGTFEIESYDHTAATLVADDPNNYFWVCFGDQ